jgi:diacylglycerol kinase family enzyme
MGIPTEISASVETLAKGFSKKVDVGLVRGELYPEGRYFGNGVGIGFDAMVGFVAAELNLSGFLAYLVSALKTMKIYKPAPTIRLEIDGQETIEHSFLMVSIMNGRRMGGGFMMAPKGVQDDGFFDVCMAKEVNNFNILKLITMFTKGTQNDHEAVNTVLTKKITARAVKGTLPVHADGETICVEGEEINVEIVPQCIDLFTTPPEE